MTDLILELMKEAGDNDKNDTEYRMLSNDQKGMQASKQ